MKNLVCPISNQRIDSNVSRLTVFFNVILMAVFLLTQNSFYIILVTIDYFIRAVLDVKYSPLRFLAKGLIDKIGLEKKLVDLAPKIFASRLGFLCALASTILILISFSVTSLIIAAILMVLATLDSVFNFCLGCWIYHYVVYPLYEKRLDKAV